jgi:hypothetical protein
MCASANGTKQRDFKMFDQTSHFYLKRMADRKDKGSSEAAIRVAYFYGNNMTKWRKCSLAIGNIFQKMETDSLG